MIKKELFGKLPQGEVYCYTLDNGKDLSAEIISYGGIIKNLYFKGTDVVLGRDTLEDYLDNNNQVRTSVQKICALSRSQAFQL